MDTIPEQQPFIQPLHTAWLEGRVAAMDMLRLDVIHPVVSGNKWYKLKHNVRHALDKGYKSILTFGGGYSNHLVAAAATANALGLASVGIVRGVYPELTPTLKDCIAYGMQLVFVTAEAYKHKNDDKWLQELSAKYGSPFIIPEGGANEWGREGVMEIGACIPRHYTHTCVSVGTATTLIGLRNALPATQNVWGYVPMKGGNYIEKEILPLHTSKNNGLRLFDEWHFGGFGKWNDTLIEFMNAFYTEHHIPLDIVYTGKMMYGIKQQLQAGIFPAGASVLCIHTGGLQGNTSVQDDLVYEAP